jgi:ribonuclease J
MTQPHVDITALGGLGEIGLNMMVLECGDDLVVIDAGLMFPEEGMYGVDVVIPDFSHVLDQAARVRGIILTHGHEDHIGALPFLLKRLKAPVYGTRLTLKLVEAKLREHGLAGDAVLKTVMPRERVRLGPLTFEFIRVSHSIIDGVALGIDTPQGRLVHTGDFKIEQTPVGRDRIDLAKFTEYGEMGVRLLLSDSTNVERPGYTVSEQRIGQAFVDLFRRCRGRIIVACFASSLVRIQQVIDVAHRFGRKIAFDGKSMVQNVAIARELGLLWLPEDMEATVGGLKSLPDHQVVLITTGSQGEPLSALTRMAAGDHKKIQIKTGDTVILSSRFIPGNERAITANINNLYRQGADVIYETVSDVHVSGHAYQEELKLMINMTRPTFFMPIHGEYRHLIRHTTLAQETGIAPEHLILAENGDRVRIDADGVYKAGTVDTGRILVDGKGVGDVGREVLNDRRRLAEHGMVIPLVVIEGGTGEILAGPEIISKGFIFEENQSHLLEDAKCLILEVFDRLIEKRAEAGTAFSAAELNTEISRELKKFFYQIIQRRPVILPQIIDL